MQLPFGDQPESSAFSLNTVAISLAPGSLSQRKNRFLLQLFLFERINAQ